MENQPIDPLIRKQYDEQLAKEAAEKARSLMEQPEHQLMEQPEHELVEIENPDRLAESKSRQVAESYKTMKPFYGDEISTMRAVKNEIDTSRYAESAGQDPNTFIGQQRPGKIEKFVGDGGNALFETNKIQEINNHEEKSLSDLENSKENFIENIPEGKPAEPFDEWKFKRDLYGVEPPEPPYDQDNDKPKVA